MSETTIHAIKSITAFKIHVGAATEYDYSLRHIKIETESGERFELTLFADDAKSLEVIEVKEKR